MVCFELKPPQPNWLREKLSIYGLLAYQGPVYWGFGTKHQEMTKYSEAFYLPLVLE